MAVLQRRDQSHHRDGVSLRRSSPQVAIEPGCHAMEGIRRNAPPRPGVNRVHGADESPQVGLPIREGESAGLRRRMAGGACREGEYHRADQTERGAHGTWMGRAAAGLHQACRIRTTAAIVFQFRVVAGTPNSLSIWPR